MRSDARRNRDAVVQAAITIFGEQGPSATMDQVAALAGVGKGTIYRSYANREELMVAAALDQLRDIRQTTIDALDGPDAPAQALAKLIHELFRQRRKARLIMGMFDGEPPAATLVERQETRAPMAELVERAKADGAVRADVSAEEVYFLITACAAQLFQDSRAKTGEWDRAATLVLCSIGIEPTLAAAPSRVRRAKPRAS
jgi:AcrR family transcriptional regulator